MLRDAVHRQLPGVLSKSADLLQHCHFQHVRLQGACLETLPAMASSRAAARDIGRGTTLQGVAASLLQRRGDPRMPSGAIEGLSTLWFPVCA